MTTEEQTAASNTAWHRYPDEQPPLNRPVLCLTSKGRYAVLSRVLFKLIDGTVKGEGWSDNRYDTSIVAWTELPEPPDFARK